LKLKWYASPRGWKVVPIHATYDPAKATNEWMAAEQLKYARPEDFEREINFNFGAQVGALAYPHFKRAVHVVDSIDYFDRMPLVLFCDFNQSLWVGESVKSSRVG